MKEIQFENEENIQKNEESKTTFMRLKTKPTKMLYAIKKKPGYANKNYTDIVTEALNLLLGQPNSIELDPKADYSNKTKQVKVTLNLSDPEHELLQKLKELHGFSTLNKEIRFLLLPILNGKEYYSNKDMETFREVNVNLNIIANNINQIARVLNSNKENIMNAGINNITKSFGYLEKTLPLIEGYIKGTQELIRKANAEYKTEILG